MKTPAPRKPRGRLYKVHCGNVTRRVRAESVHSAFGAALTIAEKQRKRVRLGALAQVTDMSSDEPLDDRTYLIEVIHALKQSGRTVEPPRLSAAAKVGRAK